MQQSLIVFVAALIYIGLLFLVASYGDKLRRLPRARMRLLVYPLSLAVYCTSWTFFGSVGLATRSGAEFLAIYIGPMIMIGLCTPLIIRVIRLAKSQNSTSIADFIAARYGKSQTLAATVALIAIIGCVPYIALQLKAVSLSLETVLRQMPSSGLSVQPLLGDLALVVALTMTAFAILFGTRHTDATEHQDGLMLAISAESIVKLIAFLAVGIFVVFHIFDGPGDLLARAAQSTRVANAFPEFRLTGSFMTMMLLSFFAIILLPRQFHVTVVESYDEREVKRARWLFPLYLVAINLFVIPIAVAGLIIFKDGAADGDMFVLALPLASGSSAFAVIAFIGGLSAATAMVIVESVALAIMVSNHLVVPLVLKRHAALGSDYRNVGQLLLRIRRIAIVLILLLAYLYNRSAGETQLASIGLVSFAAIAQFAPAFFGGLVWRRGTARGAIGGIVAGFAIWAYTLLLPSFSDTGLVSTTFLTQGPWQMSWLNPQALFGVSLPPLVHGVMWSLAINTLAYVVLSVARQPSAIERLQADIFVPSQLTPIAPNFRLWRSSITVGDLMTTVSQYLGNERTRQTFAALAHEHQISVEPTAPADFRLLRQAEHLIASAIGAASSRQVLSLMLRKRTLSAKAALRLLDDAHAAIHFNREILQTALDHVRQGLAVFNRDLDLICANRKFGEILDLPNDMTQLGASLQEILRAIAAKQIEPAGIDAFVELRLRRYLSTSETFLERFHDRNMVIEVRANIMPDDGYVITFTDITPSVEAAEALERANATLEGRVRERTEELTRLNSELARAKSAAEDANLSKTRFLAAASHDILQPLNAARLYVTSLVERQIGSENARLAGNIDQSLEAIEEILGALLDISRLDAGAMKASLSSFMISDLMRTLEIEFAPTGKAKGLDLIFMPCSLAVHSDRILLRRLLQNLISNAIKYTPSGRILVGCRRQGTALQISVMDTGLGIPPAKRREIFKEFHRLDQGAKIARGLGLGLSIVERIARVLNHSISVQSIKSGGSHFSVRLPLAQTSSLALPAAAPQRATQSDLRGATILCIDNEPAILDGMKTLLQGWGAQVVTATDIDEAFAAIANLTTPLTGMLVDYHLDHGNGIMAIRELRQRFGAMPAILITADRSQMMRDHALAENVRIFNKPVRPAALRALISQWRMQPSAAAE
jgi:Na+/proline symporter/signal transduction histidine kinase